MGSLVLSSFGTDDSATFLGIEVVATCDQATINNWLARQTEIQMRFSAMQRSLSAPYQFVRLPQVLKPEQIVIA